MSGILCKCWATEPAGSTAAHQYVCWKTSGWELLSSHDYFSLSPEVLLAVGPRLHGSVCKASHELCLLIVWLVLVHISTAHCSGTRWQQLLRAVGWWNNKWGWFWQSEGKLSSGIKPALRMVFFCVLLEELLKVWIPSSWWLFEAGCTCRREPACESSEGCWCCSSSLSHWSKTSGRSVKPDRCWEGKAQIPLQGFKNIL